MASKKENINGENNLRIYDREDRGRKRGAIYGIRRGKGERKREWILTMVKKENNYEEKNHIEGWEMTQETKMRMRVSGRVKN